MNSANPPDNPAADAAPAVKRISAANLEALRRRRFQFLHLRNQLAVAEAEMNDLALRAVEEAGGFPGDTIEDDGTITPAPKSAARPR